MKVEIKAAEIPSSKRALSFLFKYAKMKGITLEMLAVKISQSPAYIYNLPRKKNLVFEEIKTIAEALGLSATININSKNENS